MGLIFSLRTHVQDGRLVIPKVSLGRYAPVGAVKAVMTGDGALFEISKELCLTVFL